jgi:Kef-type K+ transport system membrane component KefB
LDPIELAAVLAAGLVLASILSVEFGIAVAPLEITLGIALGNAFGLDPDEPWLVFVASFAAIVLVFLAGAEIDPDDFRERFAATMAIGLVSFLAPFAVAVAVTYGAFDWTLKASLIAGTALSTTSIGVLYSVLVEAGLHATRMGKLLMGATFVTDIATVVVLSAIFISPNAWFPVFLTVSVVLMVVLPKIAPWFFRRYGNRVIEPEIKLVFVCLFVLMVLAEASEGHAVLPAFVLGLMMARHYQKHRVEQDRLRIVAFAFLTPFFFIRGGLDVSLAALVANLGVLAALFAAKMVPKLAFVFPLVRREEPAHGMYMSLLMSTGLTFGTLSALYGLNEGIIDTTQFSLLVAVVVLSGIIPTVIAQVFFPPGSEGRREPIPAE